MGANKPEAPERSSRIAAIHARMTELLDELDEAELYGPGAHVSMALNTLLREYPQLSDRR